MFAKPGRFKAAMLAAAIAAAAIALPSLGAAQGRAAAVVVAPVEVKPISDTAPVIGQLVASVEANVAARRAGVADEVLFAVGDLVERDQLLVRLDTRQTEIEKRMADAMKRGDHVVTIKKGNRALIPSHRQ